MAEGIDWITTKVLSHAKQPRSAARTVFSTNSSRHNESAICAKSFTMPDRGLIQLLERHGVDVEAGEEEKTNKKPS